jgi:hypothetical protein
MRILPTAFSRFLDAAFPRGIRSNCLIALVGIASASSASGQFGGQPGEAVVYLLTANGSGTIQTGAAQPGTQADASRFRVIDPATVPVVQLVVEGTAFPFYIQGLFAEGNDLFELITGQETAVFQHRIYIAPVKVFQLDGVIALPDAGGSSFANTYLSFPINLDLDGEVDLETRRMLAWSPHPAPVPFPTSVRGPVGPPNLTGFRYLVSTPGLLQLPSLIPWIRMAQSNPGAGWQEGLYQKLLDQDPVAGNTTRLFRIRSGKASPMFRIGGDTHLFVLQGSVNLVTSGGSGATLGAGKYAFVPANFGIVLSNPTPYTGPTAVGPVTNTDH